MEYNYPNIDEKNLFYMLAIAESNPEFFTNPKCPYSERFKDLFKPKTISAGIESIDPSEPMSDQDILKRINALARQLETYGKTAIESGNSSDANTFFRLSASLTERIISMRERVANIISVNEFVEEVLNVMEDILNADQRNEVTDRLKKFDNREKA